MEEAHLQKARHLLVDGELESLIEPMTPHVPVFA
jgi:hypothetical protein